jgi:hypothetical protein
VTWESAKRPKRAATQRLKGSGKDLVEHCSPCRVGDFSMEKSHVQNTKP